MIHWVGKHSAGKKNIHYSCRFSKSQSRNSVIVKVQGLRSLVYDVMSGVVDLQGSVSVCHSIHVASKFTP